MYVAIEILRLVILRIIVKHASEDTKTSWMEKFAVKRYLSKYTRNCTQFYSVKNSLISFSLLIRIRVYATKIYLRVVYYYLLVISALPLHGWIILKYTYFTDLRAIHSTLRKTARMTLSFRRMIYDCTKGEQGLVLPKCIRICAIFLDHGMAVGKCVG